MKRATFRTARRRYLCEAGTWAAHGLVIRPGDRYCEVVASPGHDDLGNTSWWRLRVCAECAARYGHIDPKETAA